MSQIQNNILHNWVQPAVFLSAAFLAGSQRYIQFFPGATQNGLVLSATIGSGFTLASQFTLTNQQESAYHSFTRVTACLALGMIITPYAAKQLNGRADISIPASLRFGVLETIASMTLAGVSYSIAKEPHVKANPEALGTPVGELQKKWQFPSDHLPIGVTVDGLHIASWNVMNTLYYRWVKNNSQGLRDSMLKDENSVVKGKLTRREQHTIEMIIDMVNHKEFPRSLICSQECGQFFIDELKDQLPKRMDIVFSSKHPCKNQNIVIYDSDVLEFDKAASKTVFPFPNSDSKREAMDLVFHRGEKTYHVINVHVPGNPNLPGINDLATYLGRVHREGETTVCLGDMNFNEIEVKEAFDQTLSGYSLISPYPTNVDPHLFSKCIDHFFIKGADSIKENDPSSLFPNLAEMVSLLV